MSDTLATPAPPTPKTFADFGVGEHICTALAEAGIVHPFPIQELTLQLAIAGADLIGQARTGTGKTLAFGIPLLQRVEPDPDAPGPRALVIVPTRELCLQVRDDLALAGARKGVDVVAVYGGKSIDEQVQALQRGADIVVGTPGRLLDLLRRGSLVLSTVTGLVLDEADEMLDLGFLPDVEQLIQATAEQRQTLLFSATMPSAVVALARRYMNKPTFMRADVEESRIAPDTAQHFFSTHRMDKPAVLARILQTPNRGLCVVFSRTKRMADMLVEDLRAQGVKAAAIHSDLRQEARERALSSFRKGRTDVLVATEVAARGLDISDVTHVVNYDCPDDEKMYLHRIGRTGRAGAAGVAITFAVWNELARLEMIKKALGITEPTHEVFSTSEILDELFDLPPRESRAAVPDDSEDEAIAAADSTDTTDTTSSRSRRSRGGRGRRRSGQRPQADAAEASADRGEKPVKPAKAGAAQQGADVPAAGSAAAVTRPEGDAIRRVRTRRRPEAAAQPRPPATPPATKDAETPQPRTRTRRDTAGDTAPPSGGDGAQREQRRDERSRGRTRGGTRGRTTQDRRRDGQRRTAQRRPAATVDSDTARGNGQPRLARPLVISYLP